MGDLKSHQYCFALGTNHTLCKVEVLNVLAAENIGFTIVEASQETLIIKTQKQIEHTALINDLGGTVKLIEFFACLSFDNFLENLRLEITKKEFKDLFLPLGKGGISFGISVYGCGGNFKNLNFIWYLAPAICQKIKNELVCLGRKTWFLSPEERVLSSVAVDKNRLLDRGFELVLGVGPAGVYLGKTLAIQDYESYSFRDYGRPERDARTGMIPPKLAKTMINLAQEDQNRVFLDPFCGSGTFLQELILLGYKNVIGTDIEEKAITSTQANLDWLFKNYRSLKREDYHPNLMKCDVRRLSSMIPKGSIDAIVTEPYLGSPKAKFYQPNQIKKEVGMLEDLYFQSFREFKRVLKQGGIIVVIFPVFRYKSQFFFLEILDKIRGLGFDGKNFLPDTTLRERASVRLLNLEITNRNSIIYYHPGQTISREIFLFAKQ